ncbi:MAG: helix-turn-helix domain-containing protein, partial [Bifidobacteriaceae bacterium]|nr:helix-turn-helix domain-containing protein [Bifidobacteriaceae bacterium]
MTVTSRFNYRAYPDKGQCQALARLFGCVRVVYNDFVAARRAAHSAKQPIPSANDLCKRLITDAKKTPERAWLAEVSVTPVQQAARHAQGAHARFYSYLKARREFNAKIKVGLLPKDAKPPRRVGRPVFKTRSGRQSAEFTRSARFQVRHPDGCKWGWVRLPKIGWVKFRWTRDLPSDPSSVVVIGNPDGSYEVSFAVDAPIPDAPAPIHQATGIDLGHRVLAAAVSSDGTRRAHPNPKALDKARRRL